MGEASAFLEALDRGIVLGDGAIGTNLLPLRSKYKTCVEHLNLTEPYKVLQLHRDYVSAGSRLIETNTYGANILHLDKYGIADDQGSIIRSGVNLARRVAGKRVFVAGCVGPLPLISGEPLTESDIQLLFTGQIELLVENKVDVLLFETFVDLNQLTAAVSIARSITDIPIIAQMAFEVSRKTVNGDLPVDFMAQCSSAGADVIGVNCGAGVASVVNAIEKISRYDVRMSAYMNAGFAEQNGNARIYVAPVEYLVENALRLVSMGVRLIGGCCGTTPDTIAQLSEALKSRKGRGKKREGEAVPAVVQQPAGGSEKPGFQPDTPRGVFVELNPPNRFDMSGITDQVGKIRQIPAVKGVTLTDNPMSSIRLDVLATACFIQTLGLPVVLNVTGRDRNRIALQSLLMSAHVQGIRHLMCLTGDPIRMYHETNTSGVFDLTATGLVKLAADFNAGKRMYGEKTSFTIGVALNPNARSVRGQVDKLRRKIDAGAHFALTQPIFHRESFELFQDALEEGDVKLPVYYGVMPLTSLRIARYLHNEVPGIQLPREVLQKLARYSDPRDQEAAGIEMTASLVDSLKSSVHGLYMTASFNKVDTLIPMLEGLWT